MIHFFKKVCQNLIERVAIFGPSVKAELLKSLITRCNNLENDDLIICCTALDPRIKLDKKYFSDVNKARVIFDQKHNDSIQCEPPSDTNRDRKNDAEPNDIFEFLQLKSSTCAEPVKTHEAERDRYFSEEVIPFTDDPYLWWKNNSVRFPTLSDMAGKYLCVQASSVNSERQFTKACLVLNEHRRKLTTEHVEELLFVKENHHYL